MGFLSGSNGHIKFGKPGVVDPDANDGIGTGWNGSETRVTSWTLSSSSQLLDTTTLGVYDKSSVYGLRTTTGTLRLFYYTDDPAQSGRVDNNSASWFFNALVRAERPQSADPLLPPNANKIESIPCFLRLYVRYDQSIQKDDFIEFEANISNVTIGSSVGELVALDVQFEATGQIYRNRI